MGRNTLRPAWGLLGLYCLHSANGAMHTLHRQHAQAILGVGNKKEFSWSASTDFIYIYFPVPPRWLF